MFRGVTPLELAKMAEKDIVTATAKVSMQKRQIEQLLIGRKAVWKGADSLGRTRRLYITFVRVTPKGTIDVYGKKLSKMRTEHLIGPLEFLQLLPLTE